MSDQTLQQFIESNKAQYGIQKGTQTSSEYIAIISPYVNQIVSLESQLKAALEKIPKKERVKIIKKHYSQAIPSPSRSNLCLSEPTTLIPEGTPAQSKSGEFRGIHTP